MNGGPASILQSIDPIQARLHLEDFVYNVNSIYHESRILSGIPPHPAIVGHPIGYLTRAHGDTEVVYGFLVEYFPGGCIGDIIENSDVSLIRRSKWASQIVSAVWHLHHVSNTFHGDIKLDNIVLDAHDDAVLIDFEQFRANARHLAPEACGEWEVFVSQTGELSYLRHQGKRPDRWNAFRQWQDIPKALEIAEVHALGMALSTLYGEQAPPSIQSILGSCLEPDPLKRISLQAVSHYFRSSDVEGMFLRCHTSLTCVKASPIDPQTFFVGCDPPSIRCV